MLFRQAGNIQKALDDCNEALSIARNVHNRGAEALALSNLGRIYTDLGQEQKAFDLLNQALPIWREIASRNGEALALTNLGRVYSNLAQNEKALEVLNQALPMWRESGRREGEAACLDAIGKAYANMSQGQQALNFYNQALPVWRELGDPNGEALTLNNIGGAYSDLGQKQLALDSYNQALAIWRAVGNRQGEARTLHDIGRVLYDLGQDQKALDFYAQSLPLWRDVANRAGEALSLTDTAIAEADLGQQQKALDLYNQALPIWREVGNRDGEALTLTYLGRTYLDLNQLQKSLELYGEALPIWREAKNPRGVAFALANAAAAYAALGQPEKALPDSLAGLALAKAAGDPNLEGGIEASLMLGFRNQGLLEEAIFFGTDAVNSYQQIRKNISRLDKDLQIGFARSKSATYRQLAELLVETDRLAEAEHVLDLLKEEELKEVVRGAADDAASKVEPLALSPAQQSAQSQLATPEQTAEALAETSLEYGALSAKEKRTPEEDARLKSLEKSIEQSNADLSAFFKNTLYPELAKNAGTQDANALLNREKAEVSRLQNTLADLGPRTLGIRLLLGDDHAYAIVVTAHSREKFELKATPQQLRLKVFQVVRDLRSPSSDPKPHLAELYAMVIAPFEGDLKAIEQAPAAVPQDAVPSLLWSLDGVMRYLPMSALFDGQRYLLERFNNVLFTPESYGHMAAPANPGASQLRVLAAGLSKSYGGLPALPGVLPELEAVVHDPSVPESHGPLDGKLLPNDQFTFAALKSQLGASKSYPVVHIASHFVEQTGGGAEPYLMLGGEDSGDAKGFQLTLSELENSAVTFHGTELLTLSACSTAAGSTLEDGQEVDSLGMVAQQKDAEAVLATLWDVSDASTSKLMSDFYSRWVANPAAGKAEALRQAQLALLHAPASQAPQTAGIGTYSHPYYWAPFVLIGNFQ
jgi:CHAT domain-containing protein